MSKIITCKKCKVKYLDSVGHTCHYVMKAPKRPDPPPLGGDDYEGIPKMLYVSMFILLFPFISWAIYSIWVIFK